MTQMKSRAKLEKFINSLLKDIKSKVGQDAEFPKYGSFFNKKSGRVKDIKLDWESYEEVDKETNTNHINFVSNIKVRGKEYKIRLHGRLNEKEIHNLEIDFELLNTEDLDGRSTTGTGDSFQVLGKIFSGITEFIKDNTKILLSFQFSVKGVNRIRLFKSLVETITLPQINYTYILDNHPTEDAIIFRFRRISNNQPKDSVRINDIDILINPNSNDDIPDTILKVISVLKDKHNIFTSIKCDHHPYIYSKKYTISGIKKLKIEESALSRIKEILELNKDSESHEMIKSILSKELSLIWKEADIKTGYKEYNKDKISFKDALKFNEDYHSLNLHQECVINSEYLDTPIKIRVKTKDLISITSSQEYLDHWNTQLETNLLYNKYYDMYKIIRRFCNSIFKYKMFKSNFFSKDQMLYLEKYYSIFDNTIDKSDKKLNNIVMDAYNKFIELKIFKTYGREN